MNEFAGGERATRTPNPYISTGGDEYTSTSHPPHFIDDGNYRVVDGEEDSEWLDFSIVDVEAETESMRQEAELRLRVQSDELKRFHDKICQRVTARERQNRLKAQRAQQNLDAKCAKLFSSTESKQQTGSNTAAAVRISTRPYFQKLKEDKKAILKDCPFGKHIEKILRTDAQIREDLLRSTETSRSQSFSISDYENGDIESFSAPAESPVLLPEQRVALYATVRRQYMVMNRAKIQSNVWRGTSQPPNSSKAEFPLSNTSVAAAVRGSRTRRADNLDHTGVAERWATSTGVKIIDMTSGCDVRVHRQSSTTSSTPWRKKSVKGSATQTATREHDRFLRALQTQLGTPLCSCSKIRPNSTSLSQPCANNCALYKPKKREKLLTSVYKQQHQDIATAAASPIC